MAYARHSNQAFRLSWCPGAWAHFLPGASYHLDDLHHSHIFMREDVAVHDIGSTKIGKTCSEGDRCGGLWRATAGQSHGVAPERFDGFSIDFDHFKGVDVDVKWMLHWVHVVDRPFFYAAQKRSVVWHVETLKSHHFCGMLGLVDALVSPRL